MAFQREKEVWKPWLVKYLSGYFQQFILSCYYFQKLPKGPADYFINEMKGSFENDVRYGWTLACSVTKDIKTELDGVRMEIIQYYQDYHSTDVAMFFVDKGWV